MTGTPRRIARLLVAVVFVVPTVVVGASVSSIAAPTKAEVEAAQEKLQQVSHELELAIEQYNDARVRLAGCPGQARRRPRRQGSRRGARRQGDRTARGPRRRGLYGRGLADGRAARVRPTSPSSPTDSSSWERSLRTTSTSRPPPRTPSSRPSGPPIATPTRSTRRSPSSTSDGRQACGDPAHARRAGGSLPGAEPRLQGLPGATGSAGRGSGGGGGAGGRVDRHERWRDDDRRWWWRYVRAAAQRQAAQIAIAAAKSKLGANYVWGTAGPDTFDCSGLTSWAYAQAGVYLPHSSAAQASSYPGGALQRGATR